MDNWKIHFVVVTFCALVQTYQAQSAPGEEERRLSEDWQVSVRDYVNRSMLIGNVGNNIKRNVYFKCFFLAGWVNGGQSDPSDGQFDEEI